MATYQTNAIILKRENAFEADRVYHLYTEDFGKVRAIAGSVRKINAKLAGHLEPFNVVWVELMTKKGGDIFITTALSYGQLLKNNVHPTKIALFAKMADFSEKMMKESQKDGVIWNFILKNFINAREVPMGNTEEFLKNFKKGLISLMGFGDNWDEARYYLDDFGVL